jgi:DNA invertase Pin-like site-specific DNA recombinase
VPEKQLRCAVYTRKSTEDGLEQEFNSLDAQYEACAAYAVSQRHEGWVILPDRYDDGGFSGGNMERPGLKRLMTDVSSGKVDIILLYKIDRLTRSLADFARIVDVLDKAGASFVSITQSFNTTTSMGRLTLNMLLSFAQFEREVIGERVRDKVAASKKRGMWMGGGVPTGYLVKDRKLIVNEPQAEVLRSIYRRYLEVGSVAELVDVLNRAGLRTEIRVSRRGNTSGGVPFSRGMLFHLLTNRVYRGMTVHKGQAYPGEHEPIVSQELWDEVQACIRERTQGHSRRLKAKEPSLLVGLVFDGEGRAMRPSHSVKGKVRYRYYETRTELLDGSPAWRVSAHDLERVVCERLPQLLGDQRALTSAVGRELDARETEKLLASSADVAGALSGRSTPRRLALLSQLAARIDLAADGLSIRIEPARLLAVLDAHVGDHAGAEPIVLTCAATRVWHGRQLRLVIPGPVDESNFRYRDPNLIRLMGEVHEARELVLANADKTISAICRETGRCRVRLNRLLKLSCLAPNIVTAILEGRQPVGCADVTTLLLGTELPLDWAEQRTMLGFA